MLERELRSVPDGEKTDENQRSPSITLAGKGCRECGMKGTEGRMAIVEVVPIDERIRDAIIRRSSHDEVQKLAAEAGVLTMRQDGILKALAGLVSLEEVIEETSED